MINGFTELKNVVQNYRLIEQLIPVYWSKGDVVANGIRQHYYRTGGNKPVLLLLHGFQEYGLSWLRVAKELEQDYDVIMPDARCHGHTDCPASRFSSSLLIEDTVAFIKALELGRPRVVGMSQGGATGLYLAAAYPELVHSFVYEGWGVNRPPESESLAASEGYQVWFTQFLSWLESLNTMEHTERLISAIPHHTGATGGVLHEEDYVPGVEGYRLFNPELARDSMRLWTDQAGVETPEQTFQRVSCPTLILQHPWGFPSPGAAPEMHEIPSEQPNIRIVQFENTGHLIRRVAFEHYMPLLHEFLRAH